MGTYPSWTIGARVVENVQDGVMISDPSGRSREAIARRHAEDHDLTNTPY